MFKIIYNFWKGTDKLNYPPLKIWVETTTLCNKNCPFCLNNSICNNEKKHLSFEDFKKIIKKIPKNTKEINLFHRGEPLLNKEIYKMIKLSKQKNKFTRIYTNGFVKLSIKEVEELVSSGLDFLAFSLDHPFENQFNTNTYDIPFENITNISFIKEKLKSKKPYIKIELISHGKEKDKRAKHFFKNNLKNKINKISFRKAHNWGGNLSIKPTNRPPNQCTFPWYSITILVNGDVAPCPQDFFCKIKLGNIFKNTFEEIWNGSKIKLLREKHKNKNPYDLICANCDRIYRKTFLKIPFEHFKIFTEKIFF